MKKYYFYGSILLVLIYLSTGYAGVVSIGTVSMGETTCNLLYDDNGRRVVDGQNIHIKGGLLWLDYAYYKTELGYDMNGGISGTWKMARAFAKLLTQEMDNPANSDYYTFNLKPGYKIDSWDSSWRLPQAGSSSNNPAESEMLHLMITEFGNTLGNKPTYFGDFKQLWAVDSGDGSFVPFWLETNGGWGVWYNTTEGKQEQIFPDYRGGYAMFVRSATVSYHDSPKVAATLGKQATPKPVNSTLITKASPAPKVEAIPGRSARVNNDMTSVPNKLPQQIEEKGYMNKDKTFTLKAVNQLTGAWQANIWGQIIEYVFTADEDDINNPNKFQWRCNAFKQKAKGMIHSRNTIRASWNEADKMVSGSAAVEMDTKGNATKIVWNNGVVMVRNPN